MAKISSVLKTPYYFCFHAFNTFWLQWCSVLVHRIANLFGLMVCKLLHEWNNGNKSLRAKFGFYRTTGHHSCGVDLAYCRHNLVSTCISFWKTGTRKFTVPIPVLSRSCGVREFCHMFWLRKVYFSLGSAHHVLWSNANCYKRWLCTVTRGIPQETIQEAL